MVFQVMAWISIKRSKLCKSVIKDVTGTIPIIFLLKKLRIIFLQNSLLSHVVIHKTS